MPFVILALLHMHVIYRLLSERVIVWIMATFFTDIKKSGQEDLSDRTPCVYMICQAMLIIQMLLFLPKITFVSVNER